MKREELEAMQLTKEQIDAIMDINGKDINNVKAKMDTVQAQLAKAQEAIAERDGQLETLKSSTGDIEDLKKQLESLQTANAEKEAEYNAQLETIKMDAAIMQHLTGQVHDEQLAASLIDRSKLIKNEDGTYIGLQEQLQGLKDTKKFLFKGTEDPKPATGFKFGTEPAQSAGSGIDAALDSAFGLEA